MRSTTLAVAVAAAWLLSACAKKEEAAPAPDAAAPVEAVPADAAPPADAAAPADAAPADADSNSEDAEQSGGDKVKP